MSQQAYGPLGPGHALDKDPLKGLNGVQAGVLIMESISLFLVLTVILKVAEGSYWTTFNWMYVTVVATAHLVAAGLQRFSWGLGLALVLQVFALGGFFIHVSMGIMAIIFGLVWIYLLKLRRDLKERLARGLLPAQHV